MGLTRPIERREWTEEEDAILEQECGRRTIQWLVRRLGRSQASVVMRAKRLRLSRVGGRSWWTASEVALGLGADHKQVARWIRLGWLRATPRGTAREHDVWQIQSRAVRDLIRSHPLDIDLRRADPLWLVDVLCGVRAA